MSVVCSPLFCESYGVRPITLGMRSERTYSPTPHTHIFHIHSCPPRHLGLRFASHATYSFASKWFSLLSGLMHQWALPHFNLVIWTATFLMFKTWMSLLSLSPPLLHCIIDTWLPCAVCNSCCRHPNTKKWRLMFKSGAIEMVSKYYMEVGWDFMIHS